MKFTNHDYSDVSFLIPVRIDSEERQANIVAVINFLWNNFKAHIYILEADYIKKINLPGIRAELSHQFVFDANEIYHKTLYVNRLLKMSKTNIVVIWDADVIAYPELIFNGVCRIRDQRSFLVIPYDGRVHALNPLVSTIYRQTLDFDLLKNNSDLMELAYGYYSTGGVFIVNREKYLEQGGENENFLGWGPEDMDRVKRMEVLGLGVFYEPGGGLFHLWHPRNKNSWYANKDIELHNRKEFLNTCRSDRTTLLKHIRNGKRINA